MANVACAVLPIGQSRLLIVSTLALSTCTHVTLDATPSQSGLFGLANCGVRVSSAQEPAPRV